MAFIGESVPLEAISGIFTAQVNGILTACGGKRVRSFYRAMARDDLEAILQRIDRRLAVVGKTDHGASKEAGLSADYIRNMRRGKARTVKLGPMQQLAPVLGSTPEWLMTEMGPEDPQIDQHTIPVLGHVGAGGIVIVEGDQGEIDRVHAPSDASANTVAVKIVGSSLGRTFENWHAYYDDARTPPTDDLIGRLCVVRLETGHMYIKTLRKGRGKRFTLEGNYEAPIENVVVTWAARAKIADLR